MAVAHFRPNRVAAAKGVFGATAREVIFGIPRHVLARA